VCFCHIVCLVAPLSKIVSLVLGSTCLPLSHAKTRGPRHDKCNVFHGRTTQTHIRYWIIAKE
jgi:hypothetical protein